MSKQQIIAKRNEDGRIGISAAVVGTTMDLRNGQIVVITEVDGENVTAEYVNHPIIDVVGKWLMKAGKESNFSVMLIIRAIAHLAHHCPDMTMFTLANFLGQTMQWPVAWVNAREALGWPLDDDSEVRVGSAAQPTNVVVNMEIPAVEEEIVDIRRDQAGFIQSAVKTRRRKQPAPAVAT